MDGTRLQQKVRSGYEKSARRIGVPFSRYRPTLATNPFSAAPLAVLCAFASFGNSFNFTRGQEPGEHIFNVLADASNLAQGDYLVNGPLWTYLVTRVPVLAPPTAVLCNTTVTITRAQSRVAGLNPYGGDIQGADTPILAGYPTRIKVAKATGSITDLPADGSQSQAELWLPTVVPIRSGDIATDGRGRRYILGSVEADDGIYIVKARSVTG